MEPIFALDIGTRVVMGLVMTKNEHGYEILAGASTEHRQRAMYDGQVHDVDEVARAVTTVKSSLEKTLNLSLTQVAVAAAGRALRTELAEAERQELLPVRWEREDTLALELEAVHKALHKLKAVSENDSIQYHCVGYSPISYWNETEEIANLIGQRGQRAKVSVIATFLPRTVVDGLVSVLARAGLTMTSLTLEPIAAGQAAIPSNMRRFNLALVDIGAGTADIALTREGSFFAYGMVPMAGDEVTEAICGHYLLDFKVGERIKRELKTKPAMKFTDFLGTKVSVPREELLTVIDPVVSKLAERISAEILKLNKATPQAIILIGGGSLTPMLPEKLAECFEISPKRVGLQVRERISNVEGEKRLKGPETVTPIGIGISALEGSGLQYYTVTVNGIPVPIFEVQLTTVAEALLAAGISPRSFVGKPGAALTYELNQELHIIKGTLGAPVRLIVNSEPGRLEQTLKNGDRIEFSPAEAGADAETTVAEILPIYESKRIFWNGEAEEFYPLVLLGDRPLRQTDRILDGYKLTYIPNQDLQNLLAQKSLFEKQQISLIETLTVVINGEPRTLQLKRTVLVNGRVCEENCPIREGDSLEVRLRKNTVADLNLQAKPLHFTVNGAEIEYPPQILEIKSRGRTISENHPLENGLDLWVNGFKQMPIFSDLMPYVKFPEPMPAGKKLNLSVNGQTAQFTTVLHPGDRLSVNFE